MVAGKLTNFGGMQPAVDPYLLQDGQAQTALNAWLYSGALEGFRQPTLVHTLAATTARKVYRIPKLYYDKDHIVDSHWMEFLNPDTDVIRSPVVNDAHERFYWASAQSFLPALPQYNTKARIIAGDPAFRIGVPSPSVAPSVSRANGQYFLSASGQRFSLIPGSAGIYYSKGFAPDQESYSVGGVRGETPELAGATSPVSSIKGNLDRSGTPISSTATRNRYAMTGGRAELRYGTTIAGQRVTISDTGAVTHGVPPQPSPAGVSQDYVGKGVLEARAYVYTWVSAYGEEGAPSPATLYTGWSEDTWNIKVTAPGILDTTDRNITQTRIYRTVTAVGGATTYFFVAELPVATLQYSDTLTNDVVAANDILETSLWTPPPDDLDGMVLMPNGIIAGWRKNEVWFCEPYRPHAWPVSYVVGVEYPVVGAAVIGQTLIVCTTGSPYAISGIHPSTMSVSKIAAYEPCVSRGSIVAVPSGVAYASSNGIVIANAGGVQVVTRDIIGKDDWIDAGMYLNITSLRAAPLNGAYYCWGSVRSGCFSTEAFLSTAFLQDDYTGAYQGAVIDPTNQRLMFVSLGHDTPTNNCFADQWTGETFLIRDGAVYWVDVSNTRAHGEYLWRSKLYTMPNKRNLEAYRVWFSTFPETPEIADTRNTALVQSLAADQYGLVRVYADGRLVVTRELRTSGEIMRVPSGFKAEFWQFEIEARVKVTGLEWATSAKELMLA